MYWKDVEQLRIQQSFNRFGSIDNDSIDDDDDDNNEMMDNLPFPTISLFVSRHLYNVFYFYLLMIQLSIFTNVIEILSQFLSINNNRLLHWFLVQH